MAHTPAQTLCIIGVIALATVLTRFLPFWLFPSGRKTPGWLLRLGDTLPYAAVGMLVVYCLKNTTLTSRPYGIPALVGVALTAGLHARFRSTLLSIGAGTACYMVLLRCMV